MAAEDLLRLAWEAEHDGRKPLRDALLTLAIGESTLDDDWPERCRARLVAERPGHYLAGFASVREAIADPRVLAARDRLRRKYPEPRVRSLQLRAAATRGPYTGRLESLGPMIEDLAWLPAEAENVRRDSAQAARGPRSIGRVARSLHAGPDPADSGGWTPAEVDRDWAPPDWERDEPRAAVDPPRFEYISIFFALAMLLAKLPAPAGQD